MFSPPSVCEQDISKSCRRIWTQFGGQVGCVTRMNCLDFGEDQDPDLDPTLTIFRVIGQKTIYNTRFQKVA